MAEEEQSSKSGTSFTGQYYFHFADMNFIPIMMLSLKNSYVVCFLNVLFSFNIFF